MSWFCVRLFLRLKKIVCILYELQDGETGLFWSNVYRLLLNAYSWVESLQVCICVEGALSLFSNMSSVELVLDLFVTHVVY